MMELTNHATIRLQQRGMRPDDIELILRYGTTVPDGFFLRRKDVSRAVSDLKGLIKRLEHLQDRAIIVEGDTVVSAYPVTRQKQKHFGRR